GAARLTPVHGRALPARDQQAAVRERDEAVEAAARELLHLLLLALVAGDRDAVELLAGEGDHPDAVRVRDDPVRPVQGLVLQDGLGGAPRPDAEDRVAPR